MPGWHEITRPYRDSGDIEVLGIVQEQHPDRTRLFMQWKQMDWPILVDSLNLLGVSGVPITLLVDEAGIIRSIGPKPDDFKKFLESTNEMGTVRTETEKHKKEKGTEHNYGTEKGHTEKGTEHSFSVSQSRRIDHLNAQKSFLWGGMDGLEKSLKGYKSLIASDSGDAVAHFRLGVVYRKRYESGQQQIEDFKLAVKHWTTALELNPNQYIWRRRIQQFGPRLDKPYSFYDWVSEARTEIRTRGDQPVALRSEPRGAELAFPEKTFQDSESGMNEPDPNGKIFRDKEALIKAFMVSVPDTSGKRKLWRIHLSFEPDHLRRVHWNNEVDDFVLWVNQPKDWKIDRQKILIRVPNTAVSSETRNAEFEILAPDTFEIGKQTVDGYALYYICEDVDGTCLYRRQDITINLER